MTRRLEQFNYSQQLLDVWSRAAIEPNGIRISFPAKNEAHSFLCQLNRTRAKLRRESANLYPIGDPNHGTSPYDNLRAGLHSDGNQHYVRIIPRQTTAINITIEPDPGDPS